MLFNLKFKKCYYIPSRRACNSRESSVQFSSVAQSCPTVCNPMNRSTPGLPVHHQLPEFTQITCPLSWWCHPTISFLSSTSPPSFNLSQHQCLFKWVSSSHQVANVLAFQLQHQSFQWTLRTISFRMDWLDLLARLSRVLSNTTVQKHQFFSAQLSS